MYELKIYRGVICHDNEEWCKIWRRIDMSVQNWHEEFDEFWPKHLKISEICPLKVCYIFFSLFLSLSESPRQARKNVFYFTSKDILFSRKSNFSILDFQISWCHQMPKHETRNTFYWITWEVNTVYYQNLASLCQIPKEIILSKNYKKTTASKLVSSPFVFGKN